MVLAGQYLERSVVVGDLDALHRRGKRERPCAIASPHPALGGSMIAPVIAELAWALTRAGFPTMRFDFCGVRASCGEPRHEAGSLRIGDVSGEAEDLRKILDQLLATTHMPAACAVGDSFGAKVALGAAADPRISHLALIAPPHKLADFSAPPSLRKPLLLVFAHPHSYFDPTALQLPDQATPQAIP